ncbi:MAG TPA: divalent-cation tolerance protein CutA [Candidatus Omnitrophota bacterium]|nr:divalent-cation tolerance protein CutA [Candidatus Omnitrophota bacterium]HPT07234.1 divalent-cation tolerance protein CutA [Candidatus Omnitrophota bacterium]
MYIIVLITTANKEEANKIAYALLTNKVAACVNMIDSVESAYWWQGKIETGKEVLLVAKTKTAKFNAIVKLVKALHSYTVPEIIAVPIVSGEQSYLRWLDESLRKSS